MGIDQRDRSRRDIQFNTSKSPANIDVSENIAHQ